MKQSDLALSLVLLLAAPAGADKLITRDRRIIDVEKAREDGDHYRLVFEHGEILCPKDRVASVEIEGDMSDYVPANDRERQLLEKGHVRYQGKWISKAAYVRELEKEAEARREKTEELAAHSDFRNAYEAETKHFVIKTNTSPELLEHYSELLEAYYRLMDDRIGIDPTPTMRRTKMTVNIYKSHDDFLSHGYSEIDESVLGYFSSDDQTLNFYHDYKEPGLSNMVGLHECTHLLTYLVDQDFLPQIWINEAVADYFGSATIEEDKRGRYELEPGLAQLGEVFTMQEVFQKGENRSLEQILLCKDEDFHGFEYSHAWSFVYFLQNTPKYSKPFDKFFKQLYTRKLKGFKPEQLDAGWGDKTGLRMRYTDEDVRDALLKALKVDELAELEEEWKAFVLSIEVDGAQARFQRGYEFMTYGTGEPQQALEDLDYAIANGVEDARAYWARGSLYAFAGNDERSVADMRKAIELAPLDSLYRADLAWVLTGYWTGSEDELGGTDEEQELALAQFGLAKELSPDSVLFQELYDGYREKLGR